MILGATAAMVGSFSFLRKRALIGDAIAHAVLPGVCLSYLMFQSKHPILMLLGAVSTGWMALLSIDAIVRRTKLKTDAAIGLVLSVFFGLGILLLTTIQHSGNASQTGLDKFLFGKAASMVSDDLIVFGALAIATISLLVIFFKEFVLISFDVNFAKAIGVPVRNMEIVLSSLTVIAVAIGIQAVGVVLMAALLITPAAAARYWTDRVKTMLLLAAIFGALSGLSGSLISYAAPSMPTGPWIVVVISIFAIGSLLFAPKRGIVFRMVTRRRMKANMRNDNILKLFYHMGEREKDYYASRSLSDLTKKRHFHKKELIKGLRSLLKTEDVLRINDTWQITEKGKRQGMRIVRLHRLWELYLTRYMHIASDHVHDDAETIEHIITPEIEKKLEQLLEYPVSDPHNTEIPY